MALKEDRPWEDLSNITASSDSSWTGGVNHSNHMTVYDIPYSPSDQFDLSEADFAPSTDYKSSITENGSIEEKVVAKPPHLVMNGDHKLEIVTNGSQDYKYPIQARDEFTPVYENQPFPPDLAHAISNGVNKSNLTYIQEVGEKSDHLNSSLAYQSHAKDAGTHTSLKPGSIQQMMPPTYPSIDNSIDSGVNSIDSNMTLSPTNLVLQPMSLHTGNLMQQQVTSSVQTTSQNKTEPPAQENTCPVSREILNVANTSLLVNSTTQIGSSSHTTVNGMEAVDLQSMPGSFQRSDMNNGKEKSSNVSDSSGEGDRQNVNSDRQSYKTGGDIPNREVVLSVQQEDSTCDNPGGGSLDSISASVSQDISSDSESPKSGNIAQSNTAHMMVGRVSNPAAISDVSHNSAEFSHREGQFSMAEVNVTENASSVDTTFVKEIPSSMDPVTMEPVTMDSPAVVGFCDSEVDISDIDSYLGDVSGNIQTDGQKATVHPEEPVIHSPDFMDCTQTGEQNSENVSKSDLMETNSVTQPSQCDVQSNERVDLLNTVQEPEQEQISQGEERSVGKTVSPRESTDLENQDLPEPPLSPMGARPKEPLQPVTALPSELPKVLDARPKEPTQLIVTHGEQNTEHTLLEQSKQGVNDTKSCVQMPDSAEEMDPDLAAAIALSLQESGIEEGLMRPHDEYTQSEGRPHSWGPGEVGTQQQRRPNSLNLPLRGEPGHERLSAPFTFPYPNNTETSPEVDGTPEGRSSQDNAQGKSVLYKFITSK